MTRRKAMLILGTWMSAALGRWTYGESGDKTSPFAAPKAGALVPNTIYQAHTVTFDLNAYKAINVKNGDETLTFTPKEIFEALKEEKKLSEKEEALSEAEHLETKKEWKNL